MSLIVGKPQQPRLTGWLRGAWGVALLLTGVYTLIYTFFTLFHFGGGDLGANLANITYLPVGAAATVFAWRITLSKRFERRLRWAWLLIGLGVFSQFVGDIAWLIMETILGIEPYPSIADVFYLGTYPFLLWGMLTLPMQKANFGERLRLLFDALIAIAAGTLLMWYFLIRPAVQAAEGDLLSAIVGGSYPIGDLILLIGIVVISYRHVDARISGSVKYLAAGVAFFLAADVIYAFIADEYISGMWLDSLWLLAFLMFSVAAVYQAQVAAQPLSRGWGEQVERWMRVSITIISFASYVWMIYALSTQQNDILTQMLLVGSGLAISALLVSRQWLTVRENQMLLKQSLADRAAVEDLSRGLEQRVAERTYELLVAAEVVRQVSVVRDIDQLLQEAVNTIAERFQLYYVQIYLLDEHAGTLALKVGSGATGQILQQRGHRLALTDSSINATAVVEKRSVLVADTTRNDTFRPNPLLPETRCELAVPLIYQQRVLGVLDMQSSQEVGLNPEKVPVFEALAGQLAISIENSNLHELTRSAMKRAEEQAALLTRSGWREFLDGITRTESVGYVYASGCLEAIQAMPQIDPSSDSLQAPLVVSGETVGWLQLEGERMNTTQIREIADWAAEQAAQKIENLRLLAQAEQYRQKAEQVVQRLTRQGWQTYLDSAEADRLGYVYNHEQVVPLQAGQNGNSKASAPTAARELEVRGEAIGELAISGVDGLAQNDQELLETVSRQLSAHLENLRLLEETRKAEEEAIKFKLGIDRTVDAVFITDLQGSIVYANPAFEKVYGYKPEEVLGKTPRVIKSGLTPREQYQHFWNSLLNRQVISGEMVNKAKDGRLVPIEGANTAIVDENNNILGFLAVHRDITERKQVQELLNKRAAELETVAKLSTVVTSLSDPHQILQTVVDQSKEAFGLYHAHIYELDEARQALHLSAGAGEVGNQMVAQGWEIPLNRERSLVARAARSRQGVIVNDVQAEPDFLPNLLLPETRAEMAVPLVAGDQVLGVLDVQAAEAGRFGDEDVKIYTTLASQVAVALANARLLQQTQKALAETETLYTITSAASHSLELEEILRETLSRLMAATGYEAGLVNMIDDATGKLRLVVYESLPEPLVRKLNAQGLEGTLCQLVFDQEAVVTLSDLSVEAPVDVTGLLKLGFYSYQGAPVQAKGKTLGTICVFGSKPRPAADSSLTLFQAAGQQIGMAIENSRLFQQTQKQAEREAAINAISQRIQATTSVEDALQVAVRELGRALGAQRTTIQLGVEQRAGVQSSAALPAAAPAGAAGSGSNGSGTNGSSAASSGARSNGHTSSQ